ncbi:WD40/YVTN/BNR-like repeat-containing protein [Cohnella mopanensis]|uniref:WD40/YVTN/BNR-like repeat-containing protein n=1 Tax=Cohnella mopanensis TaxID=2911966 RepID=UPI001EF97F72|nr:hypothetical protein [Cohnella mopanensis]
MSKRQTTVLFISALVFLWLVGCSRNGDGSAIPTSGSAASANVSGNFNAVPSTPPSSSQPEITPTSTTPASPKPSAPPTSSIKQVSFSPVTALRLADSKIGWAGGEGWIARTDDGGKSWTTQWEHPYIINQLFALNSKEAWATLDIGDAKGLQLLHTTNGGKKWIEEGNVPNQAFLHFVSSKEAFSGNARTTNGGHTWTTFAVPDSLVGDAYFHDRNNGWAVTYEENAFRIMHSTDGGATWRSAMSRATVSPVTGVVIRSAGKKDAWVELVGDSGMSQTSYSLLHTVDGGQTWIPVLANNQAGSGPAPGYELGKTTKVPHNFGAGPGTLYVVNSQVAFMGGKCMPCDLPNSMGKTLDGGKTWVNLPAKFVGYGSQQIAAVDAKHIWWINNDNTEPSILYTSSDGGKHWNKVHTFVKTP